MTRREQIIAEAKKHEYDWGVEVDRFDVPDIFVKGAEWMQNTMIEKATQWLFENVFYYPDESDKVELFRKAMEE